MANQKKIERAEEDIAMHMVKAIANHYIDVQSTWEGKSAQRDWYIKALTLVKLYTFAVKKEYTKRT